MRYRLKLGLHKGRYVHNLWDDSAGRLVDWFTSIDVARINCEALNRGDTEADYVTPAAAVVALRVELRRAVRCERLAMSGNVLGLGTPQRYNPVTKKMEDGPIAKWQAARLAPYLAARKQAEKQLKAVEKLAPTPEFWSPRKETKQDKRIAKQYSEVKATPVNNRMLSGRTPEFYRERWEHKHRRRLNALERAEDAREYAERQARWAAEDAARAAAAAAAKAKPPALRDRLIAPTKRGRGLLAMREDRKRGHTMRAAYYRTIAIWGVARARRNAAKLVAMPRRLAAVA